MISAVKNMYVNYKKIDFGTSRKDFWLAVLGLFIMSVILGIILGFISGFSTVFEISKGASGNTTIGSDILYIGMGIFWLINIVPLLALEIRRLRDANLPTLLILLNVIPGADLILIVLFCLPTASGTGK